jgi:anti-sigma regulatory factor (Ser/Thr protein kinase)
VLTANGKASYLEAIRCPPLGVTDLDYEQSECMLEPGSTILLYTDGLVEVPGEAIDEGLERLRRTVEGGPLDPDTLCDHLLGALLQEGPRDDVAVLAVQPMPALADRLELRLPAEPATVPSLRRTLVRWLEEKAGATAVDSHDIVLATCEAASNAVQHAYGPGDGQLEIAAELMDGEVNVLVRDFGRWRAPRDPAHGRGLDIMQTVMDVEMTSHPDGTEVRLRRRLD